MNTHKDLLFQYDSQDFRVESITTCYKGFFSINKYKLSHRTFHGENSQLIEREMFERGDAVVLMPYDPIKDTVIFNEQFRVGAINREYSPWLIEFIAGMFGENENPIDVAIREAKEEANLDVDAKQVFHIMNYLSSPGGTNEQLHLYGAIVDSEGVGGIYGLPEEAEDIKVHVVKRADAMTLLEQGKINNGVTIIALQWLALNADKLRAKYTT
ncbi:NUDIX domain-containing protein [Thalassotalea sp. LPB0316]|uniref:NUDIX domain-containing protein n=1 Tax=Thalassotalea sp. LPB0316 TaxID=2769490 RepID=UPI001869115B|nr:NUDIX domain-containing protein [Thalassotalea sp. LPB0316]QOL26814.1 NUDIX domain-containing protein [Thalassotalea sp. LPB0316]